MTPNQTPAGARTSPLNWQRHGLHSTGPCGTRRCPQRLAPGTEHSAKRSRRCKASRTSWVRRRTSSGTLRRKHGEIAEQCHVGFRRAIDFLYERTATATFEGVDRTGPVDYIDGVDIQSKYYNGLRNTLGGVEAHAERYTEFVTDGGRYHIPKDQFDELQQLRETGAIDGFSARSTDRLQGRFESLEQHTSRSIDDLVEPGETSYAEVQQGRVHETIKSREDDLVAKDDQLRRQAQVEHGPSLSGAATAAAMGGAAGTGVGFAQAVWLKYREGKNPFQGDFVAADWKDVGLKTAKGGAGGALAGGSVIPVDKRHRPGGAFRRFPGEWPHGYWRPYRPVSSWPNKR